MKVNFFLIVLLIFFCNLFLQTFAQFYVIYPPSRGFSESTSNQSECGGFNNPGDNRTSYPLTGGKLQFYILDGKGILYVTFGIGSNPTTFTSSGTTFNVTSSGTNTTVIDSLPGSTNGGSGTIQVMFRTDDENIFYQCSDVSFGNIGGFMEVNIFLVTTLFILLTL